MELLKAGLGPFVERELVGAMQAGLSPQIIRGFADDPNPANRPVTEWDAAGLLKLMWQSVPSSRCGLIRNDK